MPLRFAAATLDELHLCIAATSALQRFFLSLFNVFPGNPTLSTRSSSVNYAGTSWRAPVKWLLSKCGKCKVDIF